MSKLNLLATVAWLAWLNGVGAVLDSQLLYRLDDSVQKRFCYFAMSDLVGKLLISYFNSIWLR
jgi:hypothetical protein